MTMSEATALMATKKEREAFDVPRWFACMTGPRQETLAYEHLKRQGFWLHFPHRRVTRQKCYHSRWGARRRLFEAELPYFPRYLFVALRFTDEAIGTVNDTVGVSRVVCRRFSREPLRIPNDVMHALIEMTDSPEFEARFREEQALFEPIIGDRVIIDQDDVGSAFQGLKGIIASIEGLDKNRRIKVLTELFGSEHELNMPAERVAKIA